MLGAIEPKESQIGAAFRGFLNEHHPANQKTAQNQGFSFIELVATGNFWNFHGISIVLLSKNIENERVRTLTRQTASWLENTKKIAIQNDIPCEIKVDNSAHELSIPINTNNSLLAKCMDPTLLQHLYP